MQVKTYVGDGVYAADDGYNITLTTEDGINTTNVIILEGSVMEDLIKWYNSRRIKLDINND